MPSSALSILIQHKQFLEPYPVAGHDDVVSFLLHHFRRVRIDQSNKLGFTALMKSAIQGRTRCAKLLLFAGMTCRTVSVFGDLRLR